jgi:UTP--glucose-1-phosphate uridylyltransferase
VTLPSTRLRSIIIPAAGKGTRMLPATEVTAKELLPAYDRPVIQFAIDEAIEAGADRIIVVVCDSKPAIREFLGDNATASTGRAAGTAAEIVYVTQKEPMGLGHAVLCCKGMTLPGPFGVILPDDIILGRSCMSEMARNHQDGQMIAAMKVTEEDTSKYGIFTFCGPESGICIPVNGIVEKPPRGWAPSSMAAVGRYILQPMIFEILVQTPKGAGGEVQLTDAIAIATRSLPLTAFQFSGVRYDCGTHDGLLAAAIARQASLKPVRMNAPLSIAHRSARLDRNRKDRGTDPAGLLREPASGAH